MNARQLLAALESALQYIPAGDTRHLAEDAIADARHALALPPLPDTQPPTCGQRCGTCPRCQAEDAWVEEQARILEDRCARCCAPLTPFGLDGSGTMHPQFSPDCEVVS
jgi:hypothetical protein